MCMHTQLLHRVQLLVTPWTVACQGPLSVEYFRQEYWSGLPFPPPGDLPTQWLNLHWQVDSLALCHLGSLKSLIVFGNHII